MSGNLSHNFSHITSAAAECRKYFGSEGMGSDGEGVGAEPPLTAGVWR